MIFNLGKENECRECKLKAISSGETLKLEYVQFRKTSVSKIADIMENGVNHDNQKLVLDAIICKKSDYDKLIGKRYKATFIGLSDTEKGKLAIEFVLGNIEISFNVQNVNFDNDDVSISLAELTVYPFGECSFRELND